MAKNHQKKVRSNTKSSKKSSSRPARGRWWIAVILGLAVVAYIYSSIPKAKTPVGPQFTKEGTLAIVRNGQTLANLDIELAESREDITQGLMYRRSMDADQGMLFLMPSTEMQSFWMLNTYIPLDIIFIGEDQKIINAAENTQPKSLNSVGSTAPARYVLEVNAGSFQKWGLQPGDSITWKRL